MWYYDINMENGFTMKAIVVRFLVRSELCNKNDIVQKIQLMLSGSLFRSWTKISQADLKNASMRLPKMEQLSIDKGFYTV